MFNVRLIALTAFALVSSLPAQASICEFTAKNGSVKTVELVTEREPNSPIGNGEAVDGDVTVRYESGWKGDFGSRDTFEVIRIISSEKTEAEFELDDSREFEANLYWSATHVKVACKAL